MAGEVYGFASASLKSSGTTLSVNFTPSVALPVGTLLVIATSFDNYNASLPGVSATHDNISDANGTSFTPRDITPVPAGATSAGASIRSALLTFEVGTEWPGGVERTFTLSYNYAITAKVATVIALKDVSFKNIAYSGSALGSNQALQNGSPDFNGQSGILILAVEGNSATSGSSTGPWDTADSVEVNAGTSGGSAVTNVYQKIYAGVMPAVSMDWGIRNVDSRDKSVIWAKFNDDVVDSTDVQKIAIGDTLIGIDKLYIGSTKVNRVYVGTVMVYDDV